MSRDRATVRAEYKQEMEKAHQRVVNTPDGEIGWLLRFIQTDLDELSPSEWMVVAYELASFVDHVAFKHGGIVATENGWSLQVVPGEKFSYTLPSREEAIRLQATVLKQLDGLWNTATAVFSFSHLTLVVTQSGTFHERYATVVVATKQKAKEFEYRFAHMLAAYAGRIHRCRECRRIYLASRYDQQFCTPRCQMRVASRKWRMARRKRTRKGKS